MTIPDRVAFTLFGKDIYWYGVLMAIGIILAVFLASQEEKRKKLPRDIIIDMCLVIIPCGVVGARLYYVFCHWSNYVGDTVWQTLWNWCKIWEGGTAIPGGLLLATFCVWLYARKKKIPFGAMADVCAPGLLIGQCIGRWGNFINREAFGRETTAFSRMGLTLPGRETVYVHPTFLYESLWNFAGFLLLHFWFRKHERKFDGELILLYAVWYGIGRALIEGLRTDSLYITGTGIRVSQLLAGVSAAAAAVVLALFYTGKLRHAPRYVDRGGQPNA